MRTLAAGALFLLLGSGFVTGADEAAPPARDTRRGDEMITRYFASETAKIATASLADVQTKEDWLARQAEDRRRLFEMLGLDPLPERTPLEATVTKTLDHPEFTVQNLHFQSRPGLYVTANFYLPKKRAGKVPAILYVCGHGKVKDGNVSLGNKTHYQHHGGWFARHGYACLTIDTVQLGEIEGVHHGTYTLGQWWWNSRGYTSAGVEAWNCIRALDYLQSRDEIDGEKLGVTGRSGGGAYSWWIAALDERIKAAVPVAGITDLQNHVVDGVVEGHCDCMYMVNTYRWDYAHVAALVAPRPLLISNTDKDGIFPLEGVVRLHHDVRRIYRLLDADKNLGLQITEGGHFDTQELHIHAFHWFNRFLKGKTEPITVAALPQFEKVQLRVFDTLPADEKNTKIQETFTATAPPPAVPADAAAWTSQKEAWLKGLREKTFRGWPEPGPDLAVETAFDVEKDGIRFAAYDFTSQDNIRLRLYLSHRAGLKPEELDLVVLNVLDEPGWAKFVALMRGGFADELKGELDVPADAAAFAGQKKMFDRFKWGMAHVAPRGVGPTAWNQDAKKQVQYRRRFMLLGQTLAGMQVWDARRAVQTLRARPGFDKPQLWLQGERDQSVVCLYASLFEPHVWRLDLWSLPTTHMEGPDLLNVLRVLDVPTAVALASEQSRVILHPASEQSWEYPRSVAEKLGWERPVQVRVIKPQDEAAGE